MATAPPKKYGRFDFKKNAKRALPETKEVHEENNSALKKALEAPLFNREKYLLEKTKLVDLPTAESAMLEPKYLFTDYVFYVSMCFDCRSKSRKEEIIPVDDDREKLVLNLCRICRENLNAQRRSHFFHYELPHLKRKHESTPDTDLLKIEE